DAKHGYCITHLYEPTAHWVFHINGDWAFAGMGRQVGMAVPRGKAWGAVAADFNNDGRMDLFVANDTVRNFLFMNRGNRFDEIGEQAGVAYGADGRPRSGMGADAADFNQVGWV